jgi:hypothetical protein
MSRNFSCSVLFASLKDVISFCNVFWAEFPSDLDCLYLVCRESRISPQSITSNERKPIYLPLLDLIFQAIHLLLQQPFSLLGCLDILFQLRLQLTAGGLEVR